MRVELLIVDPQNDFCIADDGHGGKGALVVPGADVDMARLATLIDRIGGRLDDIHVTLDSHRIVDQAHPAWWVRVSDGAHPAPFTILGIHPDGKRVVKLDADASGLHPTDEEYRTYLPSYLHKDGPTGKGSFGYLEALAAKDRYPHVIWPPHCLIGMWGHNVIPPLASALRRWEEGQFAEVDYVTKGSNAWTEHYSGVQAEVPDPKDSTTQINTRLIETLEKADIVAVAGEALSHCVANTVSDIATAFKDAKLVQKLVLLTDASSNVTGFEFQGEAFMKDMLAKGMKTATTVDFLA